MGLHADALFPADGALRDVQTVPVPHPREHFDADRRHPFRDVAFTPILDFVVPTRIRELCS